MKLSTSKIPLFVSYSITFHFKNKIIHGIAEKLHFNS